MRIVPPFTNSRRFVFITNRFAFTYFITRILSSLSMFPSQYYTALNVLSILTTTLFIFNTCP